MNVMQIVRCEDTTPDYLIAFVERHVSAHTGCTFPMDTEGKWIAIHGVHYTGMRDPSIVSKLWRRFTCLLRGLDFDELVSISSIYIEGLHVESTPEGWKTPCARAWPFTTILIHWIQYGPLKTELTAICLEPKVMDYFEELITEMRRVYSRPVESVDRSAIPPHPSKPPEPALEDPLSYWFDWRQACLKLGFKVTLEEVAKRSGYSLSHVKQQHAEYRAEKE